MIKIFSLCILFISMITISNSQEEELLDNFKQFLLSEQIPAIFEPEYVAANEADIDDDS